MSRDIAALNLQEEEVYWQTFVDGADHKLNGQHDYILHFPPGVLSPNDASWSLTVGDSRRRMVDSPIHRYSVGGRSGLVPNADGSYRHLHTKHSCSWLPSPNGNCMLWLRMYQPGATILRGEYHVPPVNGRKVPQT